MRLKLVRLHECGEATTMLILILMKNISSVININACYLAIQTGTPWIRMSRVEISVMMVIGDHTIMVTVDHRSQICPGPSG